MRHTQGEPPKELSTCSRRGRCFRLARPRWTSLWLIMTFQPSKRILPSSSTTATLRCLPIWQFTPTTSRVCPIALASFKYSWIWLHAFWKRCCASSSVKSQSLSGFDKPVCPVRRVLGGFGRERRSMERSGGGVSGP